MRWTKAYDPQRRPTPLSDSGWLRQGGRRRRPGGTIRFGRNHNAKWHRPWIKFSRWTQCTEGPSSRHSPVRSVGT